MKNRLLPVVLVVLIILSLGSFTYSLEASRQTAELKTIIAKLPKSPIVYQGKDGYTPKLGIDYFLPENGKNGINSISFVTSETVVKEVPLAGIPGIPGVDGVNGIDAPIQEIRINESTGDLESKLSDAAFWKVLLQCNEFREVCPNGDSI